MATLNIEFLINASIENIILNLDSIFENLIQEIKSYLNIDLVYSSIKISYSEEEPVFSNPKGDFFKVGVKTTLSKKSLIIYISSNFKNFIKIILLHEAYKCFVPTNLQENKIINIFIIQKVEIDLQKAENIKIWKEFKRKRVVNYDFIDAEFDRLERFLKQEGTEKRPSPFQFFFLYIRKNVDLINYTEDELFSLEKKGFYDKIFEEYTRKYTIYSVEILETLRIITEIFYKVKSYRSLLDYQNYFKKFKESGTILTNLSLRKFTKNMQWIKNNSSIAPTYQLNWYALDINMILCFLKFHPIIEESKIFKIIKQLPFFIVPSYSKKDFGIEIFGYFLFPEGYLNDITSFLEKLESRGYLIDKKLYIANRAKYTTNLNCITSGSTILNVKKKNYKKDYEMEFEIDYTHKKFKSNLTLLDWYLIDRIRYFSITGLGFERKLDSLKDLKSDLLNEIESQRKLIKEIKTNLKKINGSRDLRNQILELIDNNQSFGFFYIKQILYDYITVFDLIMNRLVDNPSISDYFKFQDFIKNQGISKAISDNIVLTKIRKNVIRDSLSQYLKSPKNFLEKVEVYRSFYEIFNSFYNLKLFDLNSIKSLIQDEFLIKKIYQSKEEKLKNSYESYRIYKITNQMIEQRIEDFLYNDPPVIQPNLLNTIILLTPLTKFYPVLILKDTPKTRKNIEKIKWFFPRIVILELSEHKTANKFTYLRIQMPNLRLKEKQLLFSIFYNLFKENIIICKPYLYSYFQETFALKDFYDLERENFFYTKALFEQFYIYVQKTFNREIEPISESYSKPFGAFWSKKHNLSSFVNNIEKRMSKEYIDLGMKNLIKLLDFNKNLENNLIDLEKFKLSKKDDFFSNYIDAINFIPTFQRFGFGQYYVYFYPTDLQQIDFKHFLHNSFQKLKFPACIDNSNSFLIQFIWPYRNPNNYLLNWLNKSKRIIREYCLFFIKKVFQILHINYNLSVNEWDLDANRFKIYFQNVLFKPDYNLVLPELKEFNIGDLNISNYFTPNSSEFEALNQLYNWKSIDIKSYLGTRNYPVINHIIELLEKKLIFPIISVKNLDLKDKIHIILPNVKKEHNETILKIFSFFNVGFIYEIEGEYYIRGFNEEIKFENGLMIKLYLPDCQLDEFEVLFDLIFEYLKIEHYIILNDLVDGKDFLKSIYGNLDFLKTYNPLKNLIWNEKDKIWMNYKLFTNKFEKIYPPLNTDD